MALRDEEGVFAADVQTIALAIGDDQDRSFLRKVGSLFNKVDARLQNGAASPFHFDAIADLLGGDVTLIVRGRVAEDEPHQADVARGAVAGNRAEAHREKIAVHGAGRVEDYRERSIYVFR